ncbi:MAG: peptidoglycan DD-metalloendopeptidase family protein [Proteobacteria bacterium]|nr:peptidoglycan DD-metalloendopeptidase family protein [Pseudomonadota bacterium]
MAQGAARASALVACAAGALATFLGDASAQTRHASLTQVERDRRVEDARARQLRAQADAARTEIATLNTRLVESAQRRAAAEAAATAAEDHLRALNAQMDNETQRRLSARDAFESALIAAAFSQRRVEPRAVHAGILARAAVPEFTGEIRRSTAAFQNAQLIAVSVTREQAALVEAQQAIDAERAQLTTLVQRRHVVAASLTQQASSAERRARQLAAQAQTLRELAARVQRPTPRGARSEPAVIPASWVMPASGSVVRQFGARDRNGPASQGAVLQTRSGAQVVSPGSGQVAYAGLFRSYGQVLILNLEGGYVLVLTGMDSVNARVGESVQAGQPVGEMPSSATQPPELYVEVRRQGRPIDPGRWLSTRGRRADRDVRAG